VIPLSVPSCKFATQPVEIAEIIPGRSISPETRQRYDAENTWTATIMREGLRCGKAAVLGNASSITEIGCMAATDFINSPAIITFGDARDILKGMFGGESDWNSYRKISITVPLIPNTEFQPTASFGE